VPHEELIVLRFVVTREKNAGRRATQRSGRDSLERALTLTSTNASLPRFVVHDRELEARARCLIAGTCFEPEQHRLPESRERFARSRAAAFAARELFAAGDDA